LEEEKERPFFVLAQTHSSLHRTRGPFVHSVFINMATSSRVCSIATCKRPSRAFCHCCQQNLCIGHLTEHSDLLNAQLTPLANEINEIFEQFNNVSSLEPACFTELEKWRQDAHRTVDRFYETKKREFEQLIHRERNKQETDLNRLRDQVNELIREQETTQEHIESISDSIRSFQRQVNRFQSPQFTLSPLTIDDHPTTPLQQKSTPKNILPLSPPSRTINMKVDRYSLAANDQNLLVIRKFRLCLLDRQLITQKEIPWNNGVVWDIFWSKTLTRFFIITGQQIFTLDETTMVLQLCPITQSSNKNDWWCGTCSHENLFVSTKGFGPFIFQYTLRPSIQIVKEYRPPLLCSTDELVHDCSSNNNTLAFIIENRQSEVRLDVRCLNTFERHWSIKLGSTTNRIRCCPLNKDQWMVTSVDKSEICHISADGKLVKKLNYNPSALHAVQLGDDALVLLTKERINLHQLS
jgi:hypothetical protein